ncbi:MAG: cobyric acid synthase [Acidobacteria bacterium]|nr:cobyric acid synthase [Acidobacteriota bacterium]
MSSLFIGGTASHVGKSWFTAAFCRLLRNRGQRVAPFKAQNMSNNSYPCIEGGEIGRAQAVQAEACRLPAMADMNPVLLKPCSTTGSQVVVQGRVWTNVEALEYGAHSEFLFAKALESHRRLQSAFDRIVCEGAGSVAEVNLFPRDITNLRLAEAVGAKALLVADIERGGVFAALAGTLDLLPDSQRKLVRAFAVNRFCGDRRLFDEGVRFLESRMGIPCLGVFPYTREIRIEEEDSLALDSAAAPRGLEIAVVRLPQVSNFTDFASLEPVDWITAPQVGHTYRAVVIPGTKNTIAALAWLRRMHLDQWIRAQAAAGAKVIGICGGYQMLGEWVEDPERIESSETRAPGLGLLPVTTTLRSPKVTRVVGARTPSGTSFQGYEIHMGRTVVPAAQAPFARLDTGEADGCVLGGVAGTYLHGVFDVAAVAEEYLGVSVRPPKPGDPYDALAAWLEEYSNHDVLEELIA